MIYKSLKAMSFDTIFEAFSQAFEEYEVQQNKSQLKAMLKRRGFNNELSYAAINANKIVSFTLNGIGFYNNILSAYDTGTGTLKNFRGKSLASNVFNASIPGLKEANIKQYILEVLQHNASAIKVYENLGFKINREFHYFIQQTDKVHFNPTNSGFTIQQTDIQTCENLSSFWDFHPSWQNDWVSLSNTQDTLKACIAHKENTIAGYCIFEPLTGDISQIAVTKSHRKKGIGTQLLSYAIDNISQNQIKIINTDIHCNSITKFLQSCNIPINGKQFEMIKEI